jgi:hypothetical protein
MVLNVYIKNEDGYFVCPHCSIVKQNQNTMFYHYETHKGKLQYECNVCKKGFSQKRSLELHSISKHNKDEIKKNTFKCNFTNCNFECLTKANRRIHCLRKHFKEEIDKITDDNNKCMCCRIVFLSNTAFLYHAINCIKVSEDKQKYLDSII